MSNELSGKRAKALELHNKILVSAQLAQTNLWEMCSGLKEMRDGKLYKELGYQNFEEYCESEHSFSRQQAHKYISIVENIKPENVNPGLHLGVRKLYLLSTLSESEQAEITGKIDVENTTVKELEQEIRILKSDKEHLQFSNTNLVEKLSIAREEFRKADQQKLELGKRITELKEEINDLRSQPIEATVTDVTDSERRIQETIRALERKNMEENEALERRYREDEQEVRKMLEQEKLEALEAQKAEYEKKLAEAENGSTDYDGFKALLDVYYTNASYALSDYLKFAKNSMDISLCYAKMNQLLSAFRKLNDEMIYGEGNVT